MAVRVGIVDCSISNLASVLHAFRHIGAETVATRDPGELSMFTHLVLPGVGSFGKGMENLHAAGLVDPLRAWAGAGKPLLGLCLGMQLLSEEGEEFGPTGGLGLIRGRVVRLKPADPALRLPHVGWNEVTRSGKSRLLEGLGVAPAFYFVHSYCYGEPGAEYVTGTCEYGGPQVAVVEHGNVLGAQFHPEKSQRAGIELLGAFARWRP